MKNLLKITVAALSILASVQVEAAQSIYRPSKTYGCPSGYVMQGSLCLPASQVPVYNPSTGFEQ